jgi:hypothetical protein
MLSGQDKGEAMAIIPASKQKYVVTNRVITWQVDGQEVTAEDGDIRDDIPPKALAYFLEVGAVRAMEKGEAIKGEVSGNATDTK